MPSPSTGGIRNPHCHPPDVSELVHLDAWRSPMNPTELVLKPFQVKSDCLELCDGLTSLPTPSRNLTAAI
jgi:hypothetical protein